MGGVAAEILDELHQMIALNQARISSERYRVGREQQHKRFRANYATLHRYLTNCERLDYAVTSPRVKQDNSHANVEYLLRSTLEQMTIDEGRRQLAGLRRRSRKRNGPT